MKMTCIVTIVLFPVTSCGVVVDVYSFLILLAIPFSLLKSSVPYIVVILYLVIS